MKAINFKMIITAISAFILVLSIAMYVNANEKKKAVGQQSAQVEQIVSLTTETWYFTGSVDNDPTNPLNYSLTPPAQPCNDIPEQICQIKAPNNGGTPDMSASVPEKPSETVLDQISDAHNSITDEEREPTLNETVQAFRSI